MRRQRFGHILRYFDCSDPARFRGTRHAAPTKYGVAIESESKFATLIDDACGSGSVSAQPFVADDGAPVLIIAFSEPFNLDNAGNLAVVRDSDVQSYRDPSSC